MFKNNGKLSDSVVKQFETNINIRLPEIYRNFLMTTNGGIANNIALHSDAIGNFLLNCMFGVGLEDAFDLSFWRSELKDDIPNWGLLIGSDVGGGFFMLDMRDGESKVYYYDHSYVFNSSSNDENTYLIFKSFSELLLKIR